MHSEPSLSLLDLLLCLIFLLRALLSFPVPDLALLNPSSCQGSVQVLLAAAAFDEAVCVAEGGLGLHEQGMPSGRKQGADVRRGGG